MKRYPNEHKKEAGYAAPEGKWDLRRLVPTDIKAENRAAFLREALAHADISGIDERIATLLIEGFGVRQVNKIVNLHRNDVQKSQLKTYKALEKLIATNPSWVGSFRSIDRNKTAKDLAKGEKMAAQSHTYSDFSIDRVRRLEISEKSKICKKLANRRASRLRREADAAAALLKGSV